MKVSFSSSFGNQAIGGNGGRGANGGCASGGALSLSSNVVGVLASLTVTDSTFTGNQAVCGRGGTVPSPSARMAVGGAIAADYGTMSLSRSILIGNRAIGGQGGAGGAGGTGGWAVGGGVSLGSGAPGPVTVMSITGCLLAGNVAQGGAGGLGGNGGTALGGGLYNANLGTATLTKTIASRNKAQGGAAGSGGTAGVGQGGVYNGAAISVDAVDLIFGNEADLCPDCYGCG